MATIPLHIQIGDKDETTFKCDLPPLIHIWSGLAEEELEAETLARYTGISDTLSYRLVFPSLAFIAFCHLSDSCVVLMLHRKIWNRESMFPKIRG